jgi:hypothetical protein
MILRSEQKLQNPNTIVTLRKFVNRQNKVRVEISDFPELRKPCCQFILTITLPITQHMLHYTDIFTLNIFIHLHLQFSLASLLDKVTTVPKAGILKIIDKLLYYKRVI